MNTVRFEIGYNDFSIIAKQYPDIRDVLITNATMSLIGYYKNSDEFAQKAEQWISLLDSGRADLDHLSIEETINTLRQLVNGMKKSFVHLSFFYSRSSLLVVVFQLYEI